MNVSIPFSNSEDIYNKIKAPTEKTEQTTPVNVCFTDTPDLDGDFNLYKTDKRLLFIRTGLTEKKSFTFKETSSSNVTREILITNLKGIYMNLFDRLKLFNWLIGLILIFLGFFLIFIFDEGSFIMDPLFNIIGYICIIAGVVWIIYCFLVKKIFSSASVTLAFDSGFTDKREKITIHFIDGSIKATDFYASMNIQNSIKTKKF